MDSKNVLFAIVLSTIVLIFWATFFETPVTEKKDSEKQLTQNEKVNTPSIDETNEIKKISRNEALKSVNRIKLENSNIIGSISLEGGIIDDIIFKNYKKKLNSEEKVIFLNPKNSDEGYYIETGWASSGDQKINLPTDKSMWKVKNNNL